MLAFAKEGAQTEGRRDGGTEFGFGIAVGRTEAAAFVNQIPSFV